MFANSEVARTGSSDVHDEAKHSAISADDLLLRLDKLDKADRVGASNLVEGYREVLHSITDRAGLRKLKNFIGDGKITHTDLTNEQRGSLVNFDTLSIVI